MTESSIKVGEEEPVKPDNQPTGLVREKFVYIFLTLTLAVIMVLAYLGRPEHASPPSQPPTTVSATPHDQVVVSSPGTEAQTATIPERLPTILPKKSGLLAETEISKDVAPIRIGAAQLVERIELDTLRSLFAPRGWGVGRDAFGNLIFVPGVVTTPIDPSPDMPGFNESQAVVLASLLRPRGWLVKLDAAGDLILVPGAAVSATTAGSEVVPPSEETGLTSLRALLEPYGWRVLTDTEKGGVLLIPGFPQETAPAEAIGNEKMEMPKLEGRGVDSLRSLLTPHGWKVGADPTGAAILIPY